MFFSKISRALALVALIAPILASADPVREDYPDGPSVCKEIGEAAQARVNKSSAPALNAPYGFAIGMVLGAFAGGILGVINATNLHPKGRIESGQQHMVLMTIAGSIIGASAGTLTDWAYTRSSNKAAKEEDRFNNSGASASSRGGAVSQHKFERNSQMFYSSQLKKNVKFDSL